MNDYIKTFTFPKQPFAQVKESTHNVRVGQDNAYVRIFTGTEISVLFEKTMKSKADLNEAQA